ncbi:MAG: hypothetical protein ABIT71_22060 [Vicinamibacteraceae bacterium]
MKPAGATPATSGTPATAGDDEHSRAAIYVAVIVFEVVTLLALWWFQTTFGRA